ncbi:hypothetical protein ATCC90586_011756 [Pythium insidiosum]|nr:hypothetical protein ATCC90586_011756 [Pythium insidiosum]
MRHGSVAAWSSRIYASNATSVAVAGFSAWVLDEWDLLRHGPLSDPTAWRDWSFQASRAFVSDGLHMCSIGMDGLAACSEVNRKMSSSWLAPSAHQSRSIDILGSEIFGVTSSGDAFATRWANWSSSPIVLDDGVPKRLRAIATDGKFVCVIKDVTEAVVCNHPETKLWQLIGARLSQLALRSGRLYGVMRNGTLWTTALRVLPEGSVDLPALNDEEATAEGKLFPWGKPLEWVSLQMRTQSVAVAGGRIWGVASMNQVHWTASNGSPSGWSPLTVEWSMVATDGKLLCGVSASGISLECAKKNITTNPVTFFDTVPLKEVGVADGIMYGLMTNGSLYEYGSQLFPSSPVPLKSVASDGQILCGLIASTNALSCVSKTSEEWVDVPSSDFVRITMHSRRLFALSSNGSLWTTKLQLLAFNEPPEPIELLAGDSNLSNLPPSSSSSLSSRSSGGVIALALGGVVALIASGCRHAVC